MARVSINSQETRVDVISLGGREVLGRLQRSDFTGDQPNTPVKEIGNNQLVGRIVDIPNVTATLSAMDVSARNAFLLAGLDYGAAVEGDSVELNDFDYVCLAQQFKANAGLDIVRSLYLDGCKLERYSLNASVGGDVTEEMSFQANTYRWLSKDVEVVTGTVTTGTGVFTHGSTAVQLKNGNYYLSAFVADTGYVPDDAIIASDASSITFDVTNYPELDNKAVTATIHADLADQWTYTREDAEVAAEPVGVRGYGVEVYLVQGNWATTSGGMFDTNDRILRAQTVSAQVSFPLTRVQELGTEKYIGYTEDVPDVTGSIEILEHDFKLMAQMRNDTGDVDNDYGPEELLGGTYGDWGILMKFYDRGADRTDSPLKTVWIPTIDITSEAGNTQVAQDQRLTYNWASRKGDMYIYKGAKLS